MKFDQVLSVCAYCERNAAEVAADTLVPAEDALQPVNVGGNRVLLCPADRQDRAPMTEEEQWELLNAPIDLPAGITALNHICPMLSYDGYTDEEATIRLDLRPEGQYFVVNCPECGMVVRSAALGRAAGENTVEGVKGGEYDL